MEFIRGLASRDNNGGTSRTTGLRTRLLPPTPPQGTTEMSSDTQDSSRTPGLLKALNFLKKLSTNKYFYIPCGLWTRLCLAAPTSALPPTPPQGTTEMNSDVQDQSRTPLYKGVTWTQLFIKISINKPTYRVFLIKWLINQVLHQHDVFLLCFISLA